MPQKVSRKGTHKPMIYKNAAIFLKNTGDYRGCWLKPHADILAILKSRILSLSGSLNTALFNAK